MTTTNKKCIYCDEPYIKDTEHVFPHGLGGENLFIDCVCCDCNSKFSGLESELYQKSPASLMRSIEGIKGYKKKNGNKAYFKAPILLTYDEENKIVYEISQHDEMKIHLKSQIIEINGKYYLESDDKKNTTLFLKKLKEWKNKSSIALTRFPSENNKIFSYIKFCISNPDVKYESFESTEKNKNLIVIESFPSNHELFNALTPRLFFDDSQNIKIRAKTISDGISFLHNFLSFTREPRVFKSFNRILNDNGIVYVGQSFLRSKLERAIVKITLNCLFYYFPESRKSQAIKNHISFVKCGNPYIIVQIEQKSDLIDSNEKTHNILFHQFDGSFRLRFSMFNGQMIFTHIIPEMKILDNNDYCRLIIDYKNRINRFENKSEMIKSFIK